MMTKYYILLQAICIVESNCQDLTGDNGKSIGLYQIQEAYFIDSKVKGKYEQCRDKEFAEKVMLAYWTRYAKDSLTKDSLTLDDLEKLARIHNGGPKGHKKEATIKYWEKVKRELRRLDPSLVE